MKKTKEKLEKFAKQKDFNKVSMRAIATALGCSHGAIYYHFENKTELFNAVVEKYFNVLNNLLEDALNYDCDEGTKRILLGFIEFGLNYQSQYDFMFVKREDALDPLQHQASHESLKKFHATLQALHDNKLSDINIHSTFVALHGFVLYYKGRVENFEEAKDAATVYYDYLKLALVR